MNLGWNHIAVSHNNGVAALYVNGAASVSGTTSTGSGDLNIATYGTSNTYWVSLTSHFRTFFTFTSHLIFFAIFFRLVWAALAAASAALRTSMRP
jgi:hypothetical protein